MDTTVQELDLTDKTLRERWQGVKEDFWGDLKTQTLRALQRLLETSMDIELQDLIGARRWAHTPSRTTHRNGSYYRTLLTSLGWMGRLRVPRVRAGHIIWKSLKAYQRRTPDVDKGVLEMFLAGVSTRRVEEVLIPLLGEQALSASTVSQISKVLDAAVSQFHRRSLQDVYRYLVLDGVYLKAKSPVSVKRRCILVVYAIRYDGIRELLDFQLASQGESQIAWELFLTKLKNRGLEGTALQLAVVDGNKGLWNALDLVFPGLPRQRCWAHKLRNVANKLPRKLQKPCLNQSRQIYTAKSYGQALRRFRTWKKLWHPIAPYAVDCLEQDLESLLLFYRVVPKPLWVKLRTTNIIERVFREVRRRTRPMSCFENLGSVERIIYAIFHRQNNLWKKEPLLEITQKS
jgi:transposase-like protein